MITMITMIVLLSFATLGHGFQPTDMPVYTPDEPTTEEPDAVRRRVPDMYQSQEALRVAVDPHAATTATERVTVDSSGGTMPVESEPPISSADASMDQSPTAAVPKEKQKTCGIGRPKASKGGIEALVKNAREGTKAQRDYSIQMLRKTAARSKEDAELIRSTGFEIPRWEDEPVRKPAPKARAAPAAPAARKGVTMGDSVHERLMRLKVLLDEEMLTQEEYEARRSVIMESLAT